MEFKLEAVRLVESGQSIAEASRSLGVVEQTLANWIKLSRAGKLKEVVGKTGVTAEQMIEVVVCTRREVIPGCGDLSNDKALQWLLGLHDDSVARLDAFQQELGVAPGNLLVFGPR